MYPVPSEKQVAVVARCLIAMNRNTADHEIRYLKRALLDQNGGPSIAEWSVTQQSKQSLLRPKQGIESTAFPDAFQMFAASEYGGTLQSIATDGTIHLILFYSTICSWPSLPPPAVTSTI